ncbi:MAG: 3-phosphoglycerate dehydrogenase family protein [Eubacteriales bacterium]
MFPYYCLNEISPIGLSEFSEEYQPASTESEAQGILVRSAAMHDMEFSDNLLAIARAGAGVNNIPLDRCTKESIVVFNTPGANANSVKELVIAGMLLASRDIVGGVNWVSNHAGEPDIAKLTEKEKKNFAGCELQGKKLGIIGLGAIGVKVANTARHFGMQVYGYDPYLSVHAAWNLNRSVKPVSQVEDIYAECDYITIHVPLLDSTREMINQEAIAKMKQDVVILNFARDLLANEADILAGIQSGKIKRYVTDFPNTITAGANNCIVIPHLGASTEESEDNCAIMAVNQLQDYLENGNIINSVNYPTCDMGVCMQAGRIAISHENVANMITKFTAFIGDLGINITDMINKSMNEFAYTMIDTETPVTPEIIENMKEIEGVRRIRLIK